MIEPLCRFCLVKGLAVPATLPTTSFQAGMLDQ
jgi:hypothetical protein